MPIKKIEAGAPATQSADLVADNIAQLRALFPELVTEGKAGAPAINVDVLKAMVGDATVTDVDEKYGLNWHGKRAARQLALTPSTGTLRPCPEDSVDWDTTQNLMIEGDNLEVLRLLQKSYAGKVKLIYIDPPYNTGKDFVYPDNFHDSIQNYMELTGQVESGRKISSNTEASGRFHTDWLNMIYPRLKIAHSLMRDDGTLFVSIDDGELKGLRCICDEIFGEENFIATVIWEKSYAPRNNAPNFSVSHEYVVVYAKNADSIQVARLDASSEQLARYQNKDNDPRGDWKAGDMTVSLVSGQRGRTYQLTGKGANLYPITTPSGRTVTPPAGRCWVYSEERFQQLAVENRVWWGAGGDNVPSLKRFLGEIEGGQVPQTIWKYDEVGHTQEATKDLKELFSEEKEASFPTPKPIRLISRILDLCTNNLEGDIVLDFFAGSGTTAHAVFQANAQDGGNRRFILVQLPEPLAQPIGEMLSISDVTRERVRRAAGKIRNSGISTSADFGFRAFKLDSSNLNAWSPRRDDLAQSLFDHLDHIVANRSDDDVLYELLLKLGLDLCVPIQSKRIAGKNVQSIGGGVLLACLDEQITVADAEPLALGIVGWHRAQQTAGEATCVFRDSAFENDVAKTNLAAILEQHGIAKVRSL